LLDDLATSPFLRVDDVLTSDQCGAYLMSLYAARGEWVGAFGDEQFSLGRAFYTHFEQERSKAYFAGARASDERVERVLPGLQHRMRALVERVTSGQVFQRRGFCGAGVHVFPHGEKVACEGGVIHFDTEGLPSEHCRKRKRALSIVLMLQRPERGGGLRVWNVRFDGRDVATPEELRAQSAVLEYREGSAVVFDSYQLHQIQPFQGTLDRVSATLHAAEVDRGRWETWF
jgi:hypothetical protein